MHNQFAAYKFEVSTDKHMLKKKKKSLMLVNAGQTTQENKAQWTH